ncbi:MAG: Tfp pilus assembly protein FimT/FimU [Solirubrobacterales bacterium]
MKTRAGFSLLQIIVAMVVFALVGTTMAPRFTSAASDARIAGLCENVQNVRRHIEVYRRQHEDRLPASSGESGEDFVRRLTGPGENPVSQDPSRLLERMPVNPYNRLDTVRVGGPAAGAGTHGWRFDPVTGDFQADDVCDADGNGQPQHASL